MQPELIIFDLGGVVLTNDWHTDEYIGAFCSSFGITPDRLEQGWDAHWISFFTGAVTEDVFWKRVLQTAGLQKPDDIARAKVLWRHHAHPIENMLTLLSALKTRYRLAACANISKEWLAYKRQTFHLDAYFDYILGSGDAGVMKPDPHIYEMLLAQAEISPAACLCIDDHTKNTAAAEKLGMKTILFTGQKNLEHALAAAGIRSE